MRCALGMNGLRRAGGLAVMLGGLVGGGLAGARLAAQGTAGAAKADDRPVPVFRGRVDQAEYECVRWDELGVDGERDQYEE